MVAAFFFLFPFVACSELARVRIVFTISLISTPLFHSFFFIYMFYRIIFAY